MSSNSLGMSGQSSVYYKRGGIKEIYLGKNLYFWIAMWTIKREIDMKIIIHRLHWPFILLVTPGSISIKKKKKQRDQTEFYKAHPCFPPELQSAFTPPCFFLSFKSWKWIYVINLYLFIFCFHGIELSKVSSTLTPYWKAQIN